MIEALGDARVIIVGGSGGVGKTSLSAALGMRYALSGQRTLVLTIDPARRLAGALGLDGIGREAVEVTPRLQEAGLEVAPGGSLHAMMLDVQNTFDRLVERYAGEAEARQRILDNRLYRNLSTRLSGSQEYASMQRLYEIATEEDWDRIILDTPPSTHALDFLSAPRRLAEFFDSRVVQLFVGAGGRVGWNLFKRGKDMFFGALERLTGADVLREIAEFFEIAEAILDPYRSQAGRAEGLLRDAGTRFVVVTGPAEHQLDDAVRFHDKLGEMGIRLGALIVNRHLRPVLESEADLPWPPSRELGPLETEAALWATRMEQLARRQAVAIAAAGQRVGLPQAVVPLFDEDIHSVEGLVQAAQALRPT